MKQCLAIAILLASLLVATAARAQKTHVIKHTVARGDSLELLAAEYYGSRQYAVFIMQANRMTHPRKLRHRERLRIPLQRDLNAAVGDTFAGLAEQHLGDARRGPFLAQFNNLQPDATVAAGQRITVPFHVTHRAASRERLSDIAATYLGNAKRARLLKRYNFLDADHLEPRETIVVPIVHVKVQPSKLPPPDPKSAQREARLREMEEKAMEALPAARAAWRTGEYIAVKRVLVEIDLDYLPMDIAGDVGLLLGSAYIAFDDTDSALAVFEQVLRRQPKRSLRAHDFSPKIRQAWKEAGGSVNDSPK